MSVVNTVFLVKTAMIIVPTATKAEKNLCISLNDLEYSYLAAHVSQDNEVTNDNGFTVTDLLPHSKQLRFIFIQILSPERM